MRCVRRYENDFYVLFFLQRKKSTKRNAVQGKPTVSLENSFPYMVGARGTAAFDRAPYVPFPAVPSYRRLSINSVNHRRRRAGRDSVAERKILFSPFGAGW